VLERFGEVSAAAHKGVAVRMTTGAGDSVDEMNNLARNYT
jgi:hypothetical protein